MRERRVCADAKHSGNHSTNFDDNLSSSGNAAHYGSSSGNMYSGSSNAAYHGSSGPYGSFRRGLYTYGSGAATYYSSSTHYYGSAAYYSSSHAYTTCGYQPYDATRAYPGTSADQYWNYCQSNVFGACGVQFCNGGGQGACSHECNQLTQSSTNYGSSMTAAAATAAPHYSSSMH